MMKYIYNRDLIARIVEYMADGRYRRNKWNFYLLFLAVLFLGGCASLQFHEDTVALVDGERITRGDVEYALQIEHRREDLSGARKIDITDYIQEIIDERLIIQEARFMGLDKSQEVEQKVHDFLVREAVTRLYNEEVLDKVSVADDEINDIYRKDYEKFSIRVLELTEGYEAMALLDQLRTGADFGELARKHSTHSSAGDGGEITLDGKSLGFLYEPTAQLAQGAFGDVVSVKDKFYIVQLLERHEAEEEMTDRIANGIRGRIRSEKIKVRENEYLQELRDSIVLKIDQGILSELNEGGWKEKRETWLSDERHIAELRGEFLSLGQFMGMLPEDRPKSVERALDNWIDRKVVDIEALSRQYELHTDLKDVIERYRSKKLIKEFVNKVLMPRIIITEDDMADYYEEHKEDFALPVHYKVQQITLKNRERADKVYDNLQNGANFTWLAKNESVDAYAPEGGVVGWVQAASMSESERAAVSALEPGKISPVLEVDSLFKVIRLIEKAGQDYEKFSRVKAQIHKKVFEEKYSALYREYVDELKKNADIRMNEDEIEKFENMFRK